MISPSESNASVSAAATRSSLPSDIPRGKASANLLRRVRLLHLYLGIFFAPSIIFFSLTGGAQVINLHETTPGSSYQPPVWLEKLAQVHKKQTLATRPKGDGPPRAEMQAKAEQPKPAQPRKLPPGPTLGTAILKFFFLLMSLGLTVTTLLGIYMAFKYNRDRRLIWGMLIVGTVLPISLLLLA